MNNTIDNRREVLKTAVKHIEIWFSPAEWVDFERQTKTGTIQRQKRRPDTFWLELFDGDTSPQITEGDLKHFFQIFGLTNRVSWNWIKVATCINAVRSSAAFDPAKDIPSLAERLRDCNKRRCCRFRQRARLRYFPSQRPRSLYGTSLRKHPRDREIVNAAHTTTTLAFSKRASAHWKTSGKRRIFEVQSTKLIASSGAASD